jgi:triosephosphate isomerase
MYDDDAQIVGAQENASVLGNDVHYSGLSLQQRASRECDHEPNNAIGTDNGATTEKINETQSVESARGDEYICNIAPMLTSMSVKCVLTLRWRALPAK